MASYSAIIAAAGKGERFGQRNKLKEKLGGKAVISHSLDHFGGDDDCAEIIVVVDGAIREWIEGNPLLFASTKIRLVEGGPSRAASVANGVAGASAPLLIIHDAARPNFGADLLARIIGAVKPEIGVVPGVFIPDTVAYVSEIDKGGNGSGNQGEGVFGAARAEPGAGTLLAEPGAGTFEDRTEHRQGHIMEHPDSKGLCLVQTPQAYYRESYLDALAAAGDGLAEFKDDSALYMAGGFEVSVVLGKPGNLKVTTAEDMATLRKLMGGSAPKKRAKYTGLGW